MKLGGMNRLFLAGVVWAAAATGACAGEGQFTQMVKPDDMAAAGLEKLSPAELARLNQLVEDYKSGALEDARRQAEAAKAAQAAAEARASRAEASAKKAQVAAETRASEAEARAKAAQVAAQKAAEEAAAGTAETRKAPGGFFSKMKVLVSPGTTIEYKPVESRIVGGIRGWEPQTVFVLENGQCWKVANDDRYYFGKLLVNPKVVIRSSTFGGFKMHIEDIGDVRVRLVGELPSKIGPSSQ